MKTESVFKRQTSDQGCVGVVPPIAPYVRVCPFCGSKTVNAVSVAIKYERESWIRIRCYDCRAYGPIAKNNEDALALWNASEPVLPAMRTYIPGGDNCEQYN